MGNRGGTSPIDKSKLVEHYPENEPDSVVEDVLEDLCDKNEIVECGTNGESVQIDLGEMDELWKYISRECGSVTKSIYRPIVDDVLGP
ncbi:hypothetical protein [Haloarcula marismortui]|uniref:Uncharacterized protein n=1 Tax=Haloarcula marismortui ATCC 33800 TaxID=662476 RepID=A0A8T8KIE0_9EURY|nr:hypothetical protein [Haloarcula sinaiiensis]QUJ71273.1 hypothetical protein KDQ40_11170 [Haloarcula sinaiiensis ATCC 33800]